MRYKTCEGIKKYLRAIHKERLTVSIISRRNFIPKHFINGKIEGEAKVKGRRGRRPKQLLDEIEGMRRYFKLKEEALDSTLWGTGFGSGCATVVRQTAG
jgi:hypothetical protein